MSTTEEQLKLHVEAMETLNEQKKEILDDIKDRKTLIKSEGFDIKVFDALIRRRAMERAAVEEFDAVLETYESALA